MGFSRYSIEKKQVSTDRGVTWHDVTPSETQRGNLIGTYRTLIECEDAACDLEKTEYTVIDGALPDEICGDMISILPSGIASSVTWTSGAICCAEWQSASPYGIDRNNVRHDYSIGSRHCIHDFNTTYCPSFNYTSSVIDGMEMTNFCFDVRQHKDWICPDTLCACFTIDSFMPWCEGKETWKLIQAQHYTREHCSDAWEEDGEPTILGIAERWKFVDETFEYERWIHQIAKTFDDNGNVVEWESEGNLIYRQMTDAIIDPNIEILEYVINDGILKYKGRPSGGAYDTISFIGVALDENRTSFGGNLFYATDGDRNNVRYYADTVDPYLHHDIPPSICMMGLSGGHGYSGTEGALSNTFKYFKLVDSSRFWQSASMFSGLVGTLSAKITNKYGETLAFPCRIHENLGQENDYWNSSQIGYVRRDGDGSMIAMECILGSYTDTSGDTKQIRSDSKTLPSLPNAVSVTLSNMVNTIPDKKFMNNTALSSVTLTNTVSIGEKSFSGTTALNSITFPSSLREIKTEAFSNGGLSAVSFNNVETVGLGAFQDCQQLVDIDFGSVLSGISEDCFTRNSGLANVVIPSNVKSIGSRAFRVCTSLSSLTISEGVTLIGNQAFYGCTSLRSVTIPSSVDRYGAAFWDCSSLEYVTINTTANINEYTFYGCSIKELTLTVTTPPVCDNGRYTWSRFFTFAQDAVILVPASAVDAYKNDTHQGGWKNVANMIYPIPNETVWVNIGYACVDGQRYDYECKMGRNTEYSNDWFFLPEYRTVGEPYGECDGTEPY